jgi:two-component system, chemotaxis family, sensor kinase CheA
MSTALMALETSPGDRAAIAAIFREAHTMKGTAGMVGLMGVSHLAHRLEDLLSDLRSGERQATPELTDSMLRVLDRLSRLISRAVDGEPDPSDPEAVAQAAASPPPTSPAPALGPVEPPIATAAPTPPRPAAPPEPRQPAPSATAHTPRQPAAPPQQPPATPAGGVLVNRRRLDAATLEVPVARIDELNRLVGEASAAQLRVGSVLGTELHQEPDAVNEYRDLTNVINRLQEVTERTRMVPVGTLEPILHRTVRDTARGAGKNARWETEGQEIEVDRGVLEQLAAPLLHLVRNAVGHGIEPPADRVKAGKPEQAVVALHVTQLGSKVVIAIADDGAGIDVVALRAAAARRGVDVANLNDDDALHLIFRSGVSTAKVLTEESGRGVGLDIVSTAVAAVHGQLEIDTRPGLGCEFRIVVPITLTVVPCLIVSTAGQSFAMPMHRIIRMLEAQPVQEVSGRNLAVIDGEAVPVSHLAALLGMPSNTKGPWVLVGTSPHCHVLQVESVLQKRDVVVRGLQGRLRDLPLISGASVEPNGLIILVLDVSALIERAALHAEPVTRTVPELRETVRPPSVMVVDDSLMVRELQRSILERAGYVVRAANDGVEALSLLGDEASDLVVTDIEMPNMDGFELLRAIRSHSRMSNIPVLIVTSRSSEEDHQKGLDAGADGYIVKTSFDEAGLLGAVARLLGRSNTSEAPSRRVADATSGKRR